MKPAITSKQICIDNISSLLRFSDVPKKKHDSSMSPIEALLHDWVYEDQTVEASDSETAAPAAPLPSVLEANKCQRKDCRETIVDLVEADEHLCKILARMVELKFLLPGILGHRSHLRDTTRIESRWKRTKSRDNALAMGIHLYDEFFYEGICAVLKKRDFVVSRETKAKIRLWKRDVAKLFPNQAAAMLDAAMKIGQYLEFTNRKVQGF